MDKKKKDYALKATNLFLVHRCYTELLRVYYHDQKALTAYYATVAQRIKTFLERLYNEITTDFLNTCIAGDHKSAKAKVRTVLDAIGPNAFNEEWFTEGLKSLYLRRIIIQLPVLKKEQDYQSLYSQAYTAEKKMKKISILNAFPLDQLEKGISNYYRDFPQKAAISHLHSCYGLLHEALHTHMLEDTPAMEPPELDALIRKVDKFLPK